jgi:hypothetical protein
MRARRGPSSLSSVARTLVGDVVGYIAGHDVGDVVKACGGALVAVCALGAGGACTNATLYDPVDVPSQPDKVAFTGSVCTDNPAERSFPLRVVFVVDGGARQPAGLDGAGLAQLDLRRVEAVRDAASTLRAADAAFALVRFGGEAQVLPDGGFTTDVTALAEAAGALTVPMPATTDGARRTGQALSLAASLVTGDLLSTPRGPRSRTKYVLVFVQNGPTDDLVLPVVDDCDAACVLQGRVAELRQLVKDGGGADLQVHALDIGSLDADDAVRARTASELQQMAFAGAGEYRPVCGRDAQGAVVPTGCGPQSVTLAGIDINSARNVFLKKSFVVANLSAITRPDGTTAPDSDKDGLADDEEPDHGTDPTLRDTDGDGIGDKVELLLQGTGIDPLVADDPVTCAFLAPEVRFTIDSDGDGLLDCEEALLRLDPTLFDTDGDGLPDLLETLAGTNFLEDDGLADADFDGASNIDELRAHTDPRAADAKSRSQLSYLYREVDLGVRTQLFASQPRQVTGVTVEEVGGAASLGNGALSFVVSNGRTLLAWRDANESEFGDAVVVEDGVYTIPAACRGLPRPCDREIVVDVTGPLLPRASVDELLRVQAAERQCTDFRVRNVTLVQTSAHEGRDNVGENDVRIFFGQVPQGAPNAFGIFRVAQFRYKFIAPDTKVPDVDDQLVDDFRFVLFE